MAVINTNVASLNAQRNLVGSQDSLNTALQRLSSGLRINSAKDDAAGLAIASRMSAQVSGLNQAVRNANDAVSLSQTADGALSQSSDLLTRIRDLAVQSANDTNSGTDRQALQQEVGQLQQELNRVANDTQFNGKNLLDGSFTAQQFQVGANANQTISISMQSAKATDIGNQEVASGGTGAAANAPAATNTIAAQNINVSGTVGAVTIAVAASSSAKTIAQQVNDQSSNTGVTATARTAADITVGATGQYSFSLTGSNTATPAQFSVNVTNTADLSGMADAINAKSAQTGISAVANGGSLTLTSETGDDITVANGATSAGAMNMQTHDYDGSGSFTPAAAVSVAAGSSDTQVGRVSFSSSQAYTVTTDTAGSLFQNATNASTLNSVANIDIGTAQGANDAISVIDGALDYVNGSRAKLGAVENRVDTTISNLSTTSENLTAARSRIQDADFASETANLTRAQVLQQAGTAMLAQANALPNNVLSLLR
jgi:flagellin